MAAEVVNRQVIVNIVSDDVEKAQQRLLEKQKKLNDEIKKTGDPKQLADLNKQLKATEQQIDRNSKVLKGELLPTYNQLTAAVKKYYAEFKKTGDPEVLRKYTEANALLKQQKNEIASLEKQASGISKTGFFQASFWANLAANGVARASSAISSFFTSAIDEALSADEATGRLESTLSNLGRTDAFDRITAKADELAQKFRYLDNDDIVGVFNRLIDYGKLTEKEMNDLLPVIINFAAKSRISIDESTGVIIKALEGNGKALKEYGINIKDAGSESERLAVIMGTLKEKTDGAGEAFQNSAKGGIATARQEFANLKEEIGSALIPVLNSLLNFVTKAVQGLKAFANDVRAVFSSAYRARRATELAAETGTSGAEDFLNSIADKNPEEKQKALNAEIETYNKLLSDRKKLASELTEEAKRRANVIKDSRDLEDFAWAAKVQKDATEAANEVVRTEKLLKRLRDESFVLSSTDDLGKSQIDSPSGNDNKPAARVRETTEAIKAMVPPLERARRIAEEFEKNFFKGGETPIDKRIREQAEFIKIATANLEKGFGGIDAGTRIERFDRNRIAGLELGVQTTRGKKRLDAELELLKEQERQELESKDHTENEKLLIEEQYRHRRKEAESNYLQSVIENITTYSNAILNIFSTFSNIRSQQENAEFEKFKKDNDKRTELIAKRLRKGQITQQQFEAETEEIKKRQEKRQQEIEMKQFERMKKIAVLKAIINGAEGITKTIAQFGWPMAIPFILVSAATVAAEIATINAQKPKFAKGGKLGGRLHSQGGNAIVDGGGNKIAEIEAGEGIINRHSMADRKHYSFSGTPSQIASQLNGLHGGVQWEKPRYMNYAAINRRYYADGGTFTPGAAAAPDSGQLLSAIETLNFILLNKGINVSVDKVNNAQSRLSGIVNDATFQ